MENQTIREQIFDALFDYTEKWGSICTESDCATVCDEICLRIDQSKFTADEAEEHINQEVEKRIAERMEGKIKTGVSYYFVERLSDRAWLTGAFGWTHEPTEAWMTTEKDAMENIVTGMFYGRCVVTEHIFDPEPALRSRLVSQKTECEYYASEGKCLPGCMTDSCKHHPNNR